MDIDAQSIALTLTTPFRISRNVQHTSASVIVRVNHAGHTGYGEASPYEYYGESPETVLDCIALFADNLGDNPFLLEDITGKMDK
ncbi:MAG: dipeptide epimerase, partial [Ktedonobacteraceae bacterium]